jgi:hypothetical protein
MISTLRELFSGDRALFKGLWIEPHLDKIEQRPVLHISFNTLSYKQLGLEKAIEQALRQIASETGIELTSAGIPSVFEEIIRHLSKEKPIALLIDEYDKPIIDYLTDFQQADANREILKSFYSVLKGAEEYIHLLFITGVSKFSKVSIFSDLNHLEDISMEDRFSTLLGFTQEEVDSYFGERIKEIAAQNGMSLAEVQAKIKLNYNGYSWDGEQYVYNPFSLLSFLKSGVFNNYWFETGTPTFLVEHIQRQQLPSTIEGTVVQKGTFNKFNLADLDVIAVMFRTGYLTVKKAEGSGMDAWLTLGYPNAEVRFSFEHNLLSAFAGQTPSAVNNQLYYLKKSLENLDPETFVKYLKAFFSSVPFDTSPPPGRRTFDLWEGFFHALTYLLLRVMGLDVQAEVASAKGRSDAVVTLPGCIWVMEFKLGTAQSALHQIKKQGYADPYLAAGKPVMLLGLGFDADSRNVKTAKWQRAV